MTNIDLNLRYAVQIARKSGIKRTSAGWCTEAKLLALKTASRQWQYNDDSLCKRSQKSLIRKKKKKPIGWAKWNTISLSLKCDTCAKASFTEQQKRPFKNHFQNTKQFKCAVRIAKDKTNWICVENVWCNFQVERRSFLLIHSKLWVHNIDILCRWPLQHMLIGGHFEREKMKYSRHR